MKTTTGPHLPRTLTYEFACQKKTRELTNCAVTSNAIRHIEVSFVQ